MPLAPLSLPTGRQASERGGRGDRASREIAVGSLPAGIGRLVVRSKQGLTPKFSRSIYEMPLAPLSLGKGGQGG